MSLAPAKIMRPKPSRVLARVRLFRLLDQARRHSVIWVTSPPGSGKTTLICSYLERRKPKSLWYQVDAGDTDVATLFHYLGIAVTRAAPRSRQPLPQLSPEYGPNPAAFFQLFFRALFGRFKSPPTLVFDNYQEVPPDAAFHAAMIEAIGQVPAGGKIIILSRDDPPRAFARLQVEGSMGRIGWDDLKLTAREAQQLLALKTKRSVALSVRRQLYELSRGWMAGLLLLLEASAAREIARLPQGELAPQMLFDYFGSQIFDRLEARAREVLVQSAFLPTMTPQAVEKLTGVAGAAAIVEDLCRRNYFVVGHSGDQSIYEYHPLFRGFLLSSASAVFDPAHLLSIKRRAAEFLVEQGQFEHAVGLLQEIRDELGIVGVLVRQAPLLFQQRRTDTIAAWVRALSEDTVQSTPWVLYWLGMCAVAADPDKCRAYLGRALELFEKEANPVGAYLSWAAIVSSFLYGYDSVLPLDTWIRRLEELQARHGDFPSREIEIQVVGNMFAALMYRQPLHPKIGFWERRLNALLSVVSDPMLVAMLGNYLLLHHVWAGHFTKGRLLIEVVRSKTQLPGTPAIVQLYWSTMEPAFHWNIGDFDEASRVIRHAQENAAKLGLEGFVGQVLAQNQVHVHLGRGEFQAAAALLGKIRGAIPPSRRFELGHFHFLACMTALGQGDLALARESAGIALGFARESGAAFGLVVGHFGAARVALAESDYRQVRWHLEQARSLMSNATVDYLRFLFEARLAFAQGDEPGGLGLLRDALMLASEHNIIHYPLWSPADMADFYVKALDAGIETSYVQNAIRKRSLLPPENTSCAHWPWPVRIWTLGDFRIERDGEPVRFSRKVPRRPLELLKIIASLGARDVDARRVTDELWPEAEGDAAEDALATALRRLRLLLGNPAAVVLQDNKLSLNPRIVWIDVWALEQLFGREATSRADLGQILDLYRGAFLDKEAASWVWQRRERLRLGFLREVVRQGEMLVQASQPEEAIRLYEKGLEADGSAEDLYRNLMRCYQNLGRRVEGLGVYERCRRILAIGVGVALSPETEALREALLRINPL